VGWAAAAQALAYQSSETLLMEEFGNLDDEALVW
jgi:hypothetical protein